MKLKSESGFIYPLHDHFDSPLSDFAKDPKNKETMDEIIGQRLEPNFVEGEVMNDPFSRVDYVSSFIYGTPVEIKDGRLYLSGLFTIVRTLHDSMMRNMPSFDLNYDIFSRLLMGGIAHEYYSIGPEGEKIFDILDIEIEAIRNNTSLPYKKSIGLLLDKLIPFETESVLSKVAKGYDSLKGVYDIHSRQNQGDPIKVMKKSAVGAFNIGVLGYNMLKFTKKGIKEAQEYLPNHPEIAKGLQKIRIKRETIIDPYKLLSAIISTIYHKEEIFLVYDPYYFIMGVYDKEHIEIKRDHPSIIFSLTNIIKGIFCEHCIAKVFKKNGDIFAGSKKNPEKIKKMFDDAYDIIKRHKSVKVQMVTRNGEAVYLDFLLRDQNLDKFEEIKNYKRGEEGVTRSTAIEEHGTKKTAIVSKGKVKYKK